MRGAFFVAEATLIAGGVITDQCKGAENSIAGLYIKNRIRRIIHALLVIEHIKIIPAAAVDDQLRCPERPAVNRSCKFKHVRIIGIPGSIPVAQHFNIIDICADQRARRIDILFKIPHSARTILRILELNRQDLFVLRRTVPERQADVCIKNAVRRKNLPAFRVAETILRGGISHLPECCRITAAG